MGSFAREIVVVGALFSSSAEAGAGDRREPRAPAARPEVASRPRALQLWAITARSDVQRSRVLGPSARTSERALFRSLVEAPLSERLSLRVATSHQGPLPVDDPEIAVAFDLVRATRYAVTLSGGYQAESFSRTPAALAAITIARRIGDTTLVTTAAFGRGLHDDERHGDLRGSVLREWGQAGWGRGEWARAWLAGFDSRIRVDLERDEDEPAGEPDWEVFAGPMFARMLGPAVLSATVGVFATRLRLVPRRHLGAEATLALGVPF